MRILRKLFFYLIAVPILVLYFLITLSSWRIMNSDFRITHLNIVLWEDMLPVNITVQVVTLKKAGCLRKHVNSKPKSENSIHSDRIQIIRMSIGSQKCGFVSTENTG